MTLRPRAKLTSHKTAQKAESKLAFPKKPRKRAAKATDLSMLMRSMGLKHRICFPFSPKRTVAALHFIGSRFVSDGQRVSLALKDVFRILWVADVKHFQEYGRPITGTRWAAYPKGPVPLDFVSLLRDDPIWLSELPDCGHVMPYVLTGDCLTRAARVADGYSPDQHLSQSDREHLLAAMKADKGAASGGTALELTPLYEEIPWEFLLPANIRHDSEAVQDLVWTSRRILL